jgi:RHS repeat-associated protein
MLANGFCEEFNVGIYSFCHFTKTYLLFSPELKGSIMIRFSTTFRFSFVRRFTFAAIIFMAQLVAPLTRADNIGGDVSASFPEAGAQSLAGALAGATIESSSGVLRASLSIQLPSARGASQPSLALDYSSAAGVREAGVGWGLSMPVIERSTKRGPPHLDDEWFKPKKPLNKDGPDELLFNGERLVPICEVGSTKAPCTLGAESLPGWVNEGTRYYRLELDNHARFFLAPNRLTWRVQLPGGEILEFGKPEASILVDDGGATNPDSSIDYDEITKPTKSYPRKTIVTARLPFRWNLVSRFHWAPSGGAPNNVVNYRWEKLGSTGRGYLTDVYYSPPLSEGYETRGRFTPNSFAHHVHLAWEFFPSLRNRYTPVWKAIPDFTLARIEIASKSYGHADAPREMVRRYYLSYSGNQRSYLQKFQMEGRCPSPVAEVNGILPASACTQMPATTIKWSQPSLNTTPGLLVLMPSVSDPIPDKWRLIPVDINADSLPDLIETNPGFEPDEDHPYGSTNQYPNSGSFGAYLPNTRRVYVQGSAFFEEKELTGPAALFSEFGYTFSGDYAGTGETGAMLYAPKAIRNCGIAPGSPCGTPYITISGRAYTALHLGTTSGVDNWGWEQDPSMTISGLGAQNVFQIEGVGDVNGDGVPDLLDAHSDPDDEISATDEAWINVRYGARRSEANEQVYPYSFISKSCVGPSRKMMRRSDWGLDAPLPLALTDMNGDGLGDIVLAGPQKIEYWPGDGRGNFSACRGTGCVCSELGIEAPSVPMSSPLIGPSTWAKGWQFADLNGDGYADLVVRVSDGVRIYFNIDGFKFEKTPVFLSGLSLFGSKWSTVQHDLDALKISFADINGNGITDLFMQVGSDIQTVDLHRIISQTPASADAFAPRPGLLIGIENGLGAKTEVSYLTSAQLVKNALTRGKPWHEPIPQLLQVVGRITTTTNSPGTHPMRVTYDYDDPAWDGVERRFRGFREVNISRNTPPFETHTTFFIPPCPLRECWSSDSSFMMSRAASGFPLVTEISDDQGHFLSTVSRSYQVTEVMLGLNNRRVMFAYPSQVDTRIYDTNDWNPVDASSMIDIRFGDRPVRWTGRAPIRSLTNVLLRSTQRVDIYGNTVEAINHGRIKEDGGAVDDPIIRNTVFAAPRPDWKFLPSVSTVAAFPSRSRVPDDHFRKTSYDYDSAGRLTEIKSYLTGTIPLDRRHETGAPVALSPPNASLNNVWVSLAKYAYDPFDNVVQYRGPNGRCQQITYDKNFAQLVDSMADFRYGCNSGPITVGQLWDRGLEVVTELTAPNGTQTRATYDGFGRPLAVWRPDPRTGQLQTETSTVVQYDDVTGGPIQRVKFSVTDTSGQSRAQWTYLDSLGQTLLTLVQADPSAGDGGAWVASGLPRLSTENLVTGLYSPWFYNGDPTNHPLTAPAGPMMTLIRDSFGRIVELKHFDGTMANRALYRPLVVKHTDSTGQWVRTKQNGHGQMIELRSLGNAGDESLVSITYQSGGEPARVVRTHTQGGQFVSRWMQYDSLGRLVLNAEPNTTVGFDDNPAAATSMHAWRYAYNDSGNLVGTSDARGCGENVYYDRVSRIMAEDFSPCLRTHAAYTPPDLSTGAGTESFYRYDTPEPGQIADFGVLSANLIGRLVSQIDRAKHTRYAYDWRGQEVGLSRRIAKPSDASGSWPGDGAQGDRFTDEWFRSSTYYDNSGRITGFSTGAKTPELTEAIEGLSEISVGYSGRGLPQWVGGTYGTLIEQASYEADGRPKTVKFGDAAHTLAKFTYDGNRRLATQLLTRTAPSLWTTGGPGYDPPASDALPTTQEILASFVYRYNAAGLLQRVEDKRDKAAWPAGAKPVDILYQYDALSQLTRADYVRSIADPAINFATIPQGMPSETLANRVGFQTFDFDFLGNLQSSADDSNAVYDRSLGAQIHGLASFGPDQLRSAAGGAVAADYDASGNLVNFVLARPGPCSDSAGRCSQRLVYDWDELGRLVRARRWDSIDVTADPTPFPSMPTTDADAELRFRYGSNGERVLKSSVATDGSQTHSIDVFDTLRLEQTDYDTATQTYSQTGDSEVVAVPGLARIVHHPGLPRVGNSDQHVLLQFSDHLMSTMTVIDRDTGELVQRMAYQTFGATDSDYRPPRWGGLAAFKRFAGKPDDAEVGLTYFGARYYQPNLGRWISADPLSVHGLGSDLNMYAYVNGLPTMSTDEDGLQGLCPGPVCESGYREPLWMRGQLQVDFGPRIGGSDPAAPSTPSTMASTAMPALKDTGRWTGAMRLATNISPIGLAFGLVLDPSRTVKSMVLDRLEAVESLLGEPNTVSDLSYTPARNAGSTGQQALTDTDQLLSITEQEITGAVTGVVFRGALRGVVSLEARAATREVCPGGVCLNGSKCFAAGTLVATPEGERAIDLIKVGDLVLSQDEATGEQSARRVTQTFVTLDQQVIEATLAAADGVERLVATLTHPFYVEGQGFTSASELEPGMSVMTASGTATVQGLRRMEGHRTVYNIEVESTHTYFVGRLRSWVHNACPTVYAGKTAPGPYADADGWIPLRGPGRDWKNFEILANDLNGYTYGCHSCGAMTPGTLRGHWVIDHQPAVALNPSGLIPFRGYPQCAACGLIRRGGTSQPFEIIRIRWR